MVLTKDRLGQYENPRIFTGTTQKTVNSATGSGIFIHISANAPNPVKYTDPDGRELKDPIGDFIDKHPRAAEKIMVGLFKISIGWLLYQGGKGIVAGGTLGSGGIFTLESVAVGSVVAGAGVVVAALGVTDVLDGLVMMSQGNSDGNNAGKSLEQRAKDAHKLDEKSNSANEFAQSRGYQDAHDLKESVLKEVGAKDKVPAHYNIHVNNTTNESFLISKQGPKTIIPIE